MISSADKLLKEFAGKVRSSYPSAEVSLFGSYAKGTATGESDVDICVVLPELGAHDRFAVSDIAWELGLSQDIHISTVVFSKKRYRSRDYPYAFPPATQARRLSCIG